MKDNNNICGCKSSCKPSCKPTYNENKKTTCNGMCFLDKENNICASCNRTITEIMNWSKMSDKERLNILNG